MAEARRLFAEGSALYLAGEYARALESLTASYRLVSSPNSELLLARCLRELGRPVEAEARFSAAESEARKRAAEGMARYAQTAETAAAEGAALRATLGRLRIRIADPEPNTTLAIDGAPEPLSAPGDLVVWHVPGETSVAVRFGSGTEQKQVATMHAGTETTMAFERPRPVRESDPPSALSVPSDYAGHPSGGAPWALPAAIGAGALTMIGLGMFIGFTLSAQEESQDLAEICGTNTNCKAGDGRSTSERGRAQQLIADVSLAAGSVMGASTIAFTVIAIANRPRASSADPGKPRLLFGLGEIGLVGEFQ
jgi:hypothetical protein